jgi:small-conductance mechanosensitive channel
MEMGEPSDDRSGEPGAWVRSRQYTGRVVRVTNDKIFDSPVYNYTREFPYLWEELHLPVRYQDDRARVERILLDVGRRHTGHIVQAAEAALAHLRREYYLPGHAGLEPAVYWRLTDNWLELTLRFVAHEHGVRELKNAMSRDIIAAMDEAGIGLASATYDIVGFPPIRIERDGAAHAPAS